MLFAVTVSKAQSKGFAGFFTIGYENVSGVKSELQPMMPGMHTLKNSFYGIGGEGYWKEGKLILGAKGGIHAHGVVTDEQKYGELFTGSALLKGGYVVYENNNFFIYPSVGVGASSMVITSYVKSNDLKSELHSIYLLSPSIDFGLNADQIVYKFVNRPVSGLFIAGLRTGYRFSLKTDNWKRINNPQIPPADFANNAFYLTVALGIGYFKNLSVKQ